MRTNIIFAFALIVLGSAGSAYSQDIVWKASKPAAEPLPVAIGKPDEPPPTPSFRPVSEPSPRVVRGQFPSTPPPAFPGSGPAVPPAPNFPYDAGVVNNDSDLGGFWTRFCDKFKRCWDDVIGGAGGAFQPGPGRSMFESDRAFEVFASPVTNPFYFEDPRALTEIRPIFIWQHTPNTNAVFNGGNNFALAARGSVAFTPNISLVLNRFGWSFNDANVGAPDVPAGRNNGFSEIHLGPKFTFIRNDTSNTVAAFGVTFELGVGSNRALQDTGNLSIVPYFSLAQNFWRTDYGSFNFMGTTGYAFRGDNRRSESLFLSLHLDYDVARLHRIYPLVEMNYRHYTHNGNARDLNFEGNDLGNFGSRNVSGLNELTVALGGRFVLTNNWQLGVAGEFNVLPNGSGRHLDRFRITADVIFRY
jgi:hypothetical protein